jgi:hypothetical protein
MCYAYIFLIFLSTQQTKLSTSMSLLTHPSLLIFHSLSAVMSLSIFLNALEALEALEAPNTILLNRSEIMNDPRRILSINLSMQQVRANNGSCINYWPDQTMTKSCNNDPTALLPRIQTILTISLFSQSLKVNPSLWKYTPHFCSANT